MSSYRQSGRRWGGTQKKLTTVISSREDSKHSEQSELQSLFRSINQVNLQNNMKLNEARTLKEIIGIEIEQPPISGISKRRVSETTNKLPWNFSGKPSAAQLIPFNSFQKRKYSQEQKVESRPRTVLGAYKSQNDGTFSPDECVREEAQIFKNFEKMLQTEGDSTDQALRNIDNDVKLALKKVVYKMPLHRYKSSELKRKAVHKNYMVSKYDHLKKKFFKEDLNLATTSEQPPDSELLSRTEPQSRQLQQPSVSYTAEFQPAVSQYLTGRRTVHSGTTFYKAGNTPPNENHPYLSIEHPVNLKSVFSEKSVMTFQIQDPQEKSNTFSRNSSKFHVDQRIRKMAEIEAALIQSDQRENGLKFQREKVNRDILSGKRKPGIDRLNSMTPPLQSVTIQELKGVKSSISNTRVTTASTSGVSKRTTTPHESSIHFSQLGKIQSVRQMFGPLFDQESQMVRLPEVDMSEEFKRLNITKFHPSYHKAETKQFKEKERELARAKLKTAGASIQTEESFLKLPPQLDEIAMLKKIQKIELQRKKAHTSHERKRPQPDQRISERRPTNETEYVQFLEFSRPITGASFYSSSKEEGTLMSQTFTNHHLLARFPNDNSQTHNSTFQGGESRAIWKEKESKPKERGRTSSFQKMMKEKQEELKNSQLQEYRRYQKEGAARPHSGKTVVKLPSALELPSSQVNSPFSKFELSPPPKVPLVNRSPLFKESYTGAGLGQKVPSLERLRKQIRMEEAEIQNNLLRRLSSPDEQFSPNKDEELGRSPFIVNETPLSTVSYQKGPSLQDIKRIKKETELNEDLKQSGTQRKRKTILSLERKKPLPLNNQLFTFTSVAEVNTGDVVSPTWNGRRVQAVNFNSNRQSLQRTGGGGLQTQIGLAGLAGYFTDSEVSGILKNRFSHRETGMNLQKIKGGLISSHTTSEWRSARSRILESRNMPHKVRKTVDISAQIQSPPAQEMDKNMFSGSMKSGLGASTPMMTATEGYNAKSDDDYTTIRGLLNEEQRVESAQLHPQTDPEDFKVSHKSFLPTRFKRFPRFTVIYKHARHLSDTTEHYIIPEVEVPLNSTETEEQDQSMERRRTLAKRKKKIERYKGQEAIYINLSPHLIQQLIEQHNKDLLIHKAKQPESHLVSKYSNNTSPRVDETIARQLTQGHLSSASREMLVTQTPTLQFKQSDLLPEPLSRKLTEKMPAEVVEKGSLAEEDQEEGFKMFDPFERVLLTAGGGIDNALITSTRTMLRQNNTISPYSYRIIHKNFMPSKVSKFFRMTQRKQSAIRKLQRDNTARSIRPPKPITMPPTVPLKIQNANIISMGSGCMSDVEYVSNTLRESLAMAGQTQGLWQAYLGLTGSSAMNSTSLIQSAEFPAQQPGQNRQAVLSAVKEEGPKVKDTSPNNNQSPSVATFGLGHLQDPLLAKNIASDVIVTENLSPQRNLVEEKQGSEEMESIQLLGPLNLSEEKLIKAPRKSDELQIIFKKQGASWKQKNTTSGPLRSSHPFLPMKKTKSSPITPKKRKHFQTKLKTPPLLTAAKVSHSQLLSQNQDLNEPDITSMREGGSSGNIQEEKSRSHSKDKFYIQTTAKESVESFPLAASIDSGKLGENKKSLLRVMLAQRIDSSGKNEDLKRIGTLQQDSLLMQGLSKIEQEATKSATSAARSKSKRKEYKVKLVRPFDIARRDSAGSNEAENKGFKPINEAPRVNSRFIPKVLPNVMRKKSAHRKDRSSLESEFTRGLMPEFQDQSQQAQRKPNKRVPTIFKLKRNSFNKGQAFQNQSGSYNEQTSLGVDPSLGASIENESRGAINDSISQLNISSSIQQRPIHFRGGERSSNQQSYRVSGDTPEILSSKFQSPSKQLIMLRQSKGQLREVERDGARNAAVIYREIRDEKEEYSKRQKSPIGVRNKDFVWNKARDISVRKMNAIVGRSEWNKKCKSGGFLRGGMKRHLK